MDAAILEEYSTILSALDSYNVDELPYLIDRQQYEEFGPEEWVLPYKYNTIDEMLQKTEHVDQYIMDAVKSEEAPAYFILPGYEELRDLSIGHAIDNNYFREMVLTVCSECNREYPNMKYYWFLRENETLPIDADRAARIMAYRSMGDCCTSRDTPMTTVNLDGEPVSEIPIQRRSDGERVDRRQIALYYGMSKNMNVDWLLDSFPDRERIIRQYQVPILSERSRTQVERWLDEASSGKETPLPRLEFVPYNDTKNLNHDRLCVFLKECTSCGHPTTMAYAYYLLAKLGISPESLFADFQILLPCCRMTFMSPTFKPLPYNLDEREDFYEGIGIRFNREHRDTKTIQLPNQTITVRRMSRAAIAQESDQVSSDRGVEDDVM